MKARFDCVVGIVASLALGCGDDEREPLGDGSGPSTAVDASLDASLDARARDAGGDGEAGDGGRLHDTRVFVVDERTLPFEALPDAKVESDRYWGVLEGAGYQIEVPKQWNGMLVLYAHGYVGAVATLTVSPPGALRRHLIERGYAWAASSYRANYYDVRAGVEDTNALALAFTRLVAEGGRTVAEPSKRYVVGQAMGGHVAGAAIERETLATAQHQVRYHAALSLCGAMGDLALFDYHAAYQAAAHTLTETPMATSASAFGSVRMRLLDLLFAPYPTRNTPRGEQLQAIVAALSGGARPVFALGWASKSVEDALWFTSFGDDGTLAGIVARPVTDTRAITYQLDGDPALSAEEQALNARAIRVEGDRSANDPRPGGLRHVPRLNGELEAPMLTLHTLGDLFVPFSMQQIYRERAEASGRGERLVQRAIRAIGHCEFTRAEQASAFDALVRWERDGVVPSGDDVLDRSRLRQPDYGCRFTQNTYAPEELASGSTLPASRMRVPPCTLR